MAAGAPASPEYAYDVSPTATATSIEITAAEIRTRRNDDRMTLLLCRTQPIRVRPDAYQLPATRRSITTPLSRRQRGWAPPP